MEEEELFGLLMGGVHCWGRFVLYLDRGGHMALAIALKGGYHGCSWRVEMHTSTLDDLVVFGGDDART